MKSLRLSRVLPIVLLAAGFCCAGPVAAQTTRGDADTRETARASGKTPAEAALHRGELERARQLAFEHDDAESLLVRSRLTEYEGDLELAAQFARAAYEQARDEATRARAAGELGRFLRVQGEWEEAEAWLREALGASARESWPVRLELGRLVGLMGKRAEADSLLKPFSLAFNRGHLKSARELAWLAEAMWEMGSFEDAHLAFEKMYEADPAYVDGLVSWARLLLSKYSIADAHRTLQEVLQINPEHPGALVEMARLEIEESNYFGDAYQLLARAEKVWPKNPRLLVTQAQLQIYDGDYRRALKSAEALLERHPRELDAMIIRAASLYLMDDRQGFEAAVEQALEIKPDFARIFSETADYAQLVHRYLEVVELSERALKVQRDWAPALLNMGIGLSRIGEEAEAFPYLKQALQADPYNARARNLVTLYENELPEFEFRAHQGFRLRAHRSQSDLLNELLPPLIQEAMQVYEEKYEFKVEEILDIEIFPREETFGVRSIGLPQVSPTGLCFGRLVISRSPSEGNFNWRQVLWHELAHVYHIQKAGYRVPRWFTEGLAEYETNVKDPAWTRRLDPEIAGALRANKIPSVERLDHRFTRAESFDDILLAYQLSSLAVHFIVETHGFDSVNQMLEKFPELLETAPVIEAVLGLSVADFDRGFKDWLRKRYSYFNLQMLVDLSAIESSDILEARLKRDRQNPILSAQYAISLLREARVDEAKEAMERALKHGEKNPTVRYLAAVLAFGQGHIRAGYAHGVAVLEEFQDGYLLRALLGEAAMLLDDPTSAEVHLVAATQLYEDGPQAWANLLALAQSQNDAELEARAQARLFALDQNNAAVARARFEWAAAQKRWVEGLEAAQRWVDIRPFEPRAQRALAQASLGQQKPEIAVAAYKNLLHLKPGEAASVREEAARALGEAGFSAQAEAFKPRSRPDSN